MPATLGTLNADVHHPQRHGNKTWSILLEGISRCTAAHHHAFVATEHDDCAKIVNSLHQHVRGFMYNIKDEGNICLAIGLLRDFIENRAANMALRQLLDAACETERNTDDIWRNITARDRNVCLDIMEELLSQVRAQSEVVQSDLKHVHE